MKHTLLLFVLLALMAPSSALAQTSRLDADLGVGFRRFEQQVKSEIGGARGERLVEESQITMDLAATYAVLRHLALGLYLRYDFGSRSAGRFTGLDDEGRTVVSGEVGGSFHEVWLGPLVRGRYGWFHLDLGYGLIGLRSDDARTDLPADGSTDGPLVTSRSVAWVAAIGAHVPVMGAWHLLLELEYRVRYYDRRGSTPLDDSLVHGTQEFTPIIGVGARF